MLRRHSWHFSVRPSTNWKGSSAGIQVTTPIAEWAPHQGNTKEHFYSSLHIIYSKPQRKIAFGWVLSIATCFGRITFTFVASCSMQAAKETCFFCFENVIYKKSSYREGRLLSQCRLWWSVAVCMKICALVSRQRKFEGFKNKKQKTYLSRPGDR